jgi:predicted GTPase
MVVLPCTHAGKIAAQEVGATVVDPHPYAVGTIKETFEKFRQIRDTIPAMGYSPQQATPPAPSAQPPR